MIVYRGCESEQTYCILSMIFIPQRLCIRIFGDVLCSKVPLESWCWVAVVQVTFEDTPSCKHSVPFR